MKKLSISWKLNSDNKNDIEYINILSKYKEYGYSTRTKLIAAALKMYSEQHPVALSSSQDSDNISDIL